MSKKSLPAAPPAAAAGTHWHWHWHVWAEREPLLPMDDGEACILAAFSQAAAEFASSSPAAGEATLSALCQRALPRDVLFQLAPWHASAASPPLALAHFSVLTCALWHCVQRGRSAPRPVNAACLGDALACMTRCLEAAPLGAGAAGGAWCEALAQASACLRGCCGWVAGAADSQALRRQVLLFCAALARAALRLAPSPCDPASAPTLLRCEGALGAALGALGVDALALLQEACHRPAWWGSAPGAEEGAEGAERAGGAAGLDALRPTQLAHIALLLVAAAHAPRSAEASASAAPPPAAALPAAALAPQASQGSEGPAPLPLPLPPAPSPTPLLPALLPHALVATWVCMLSQPLASHTAAAWSAAAQESTAPSSPASACPPSYAHSSASTDPGSALLAILASFLALLVPGDLALLPWPSGAEGCAPTPAAAAAAAAAAPPEHPMVLLFAALHTACARAPTQPLSRLALQAARGLFDALQPRHQCALLCTALPRCPFPQCTAVVLGWVQGGLGKGQDARARAHCARRAMHVLTAVLSARRERGLLLPLQGSPGGGGQGVGGGGLVMVGAAGWEALLQTTASASPAIGTGSTVLQVDALGARVSEHLHKEGEVDSALLCLLRGVLLQSARAVDAQPPLEHPDAALLPTAQEAQELLLSYALPLMSGLVAAQGRERDRVGLHVHPHPDPFWVKGAEGGGQGARAASGAARQEALASTSQALSSHFLLESVLSSCIEQLEGWAKGPRRKK